MIQKKNQRNNKFRNILTLSFQIKPHYLEVHFQNQETHRMKQEILENPLKLMKQLMIRKKIFWLKKFLVKEILNFSKI